jgi:predicted small secreted protein
MKRYVLLVLIAFVFASCSNTVTVEDVQLRGDLVYEKGSDKLFTGTVEREFINEQIEFVIDILDGKKNGSVKIYYDNGQPMLIASFKDNILDGDFISYHKNGAKKISGTYVEGKKNEQWVEYYSDETTKMSCVYNDDILDGDFLFSFDDEGFSNVMFGVLLDEREELLGKTIPSDFVLQGEIKKIQGSFNEEHLDGLILCEYEPDQNHGLNNYTFLYDSIFFQNNRIASRSLECSNNDYNIDYYLKYSVTDQVEKMNYIEKDQSSNLEYLSELHLGEDNNNEYYVSVFNGDTVINVKFVDGLVDGNYINIQMIEDHDQIVKMKHRLQYNNGLVKTMEITQDGETVIVGERNGKYMVFDDELFLWYRGNSMFTGMNSYMIKNAKIVEVIDDNNSSRYDVRLTNFPQRIAMDLKGPQHNFPKIQVNDTIDYTFSLNGIGYAQQHGINYSEMITGFDFIRINGYERDTSYKRLQDLNDSVLISGVDYVPISNSNFHGGDFFNSMKERFNDQIIPDFSWNRKLDRFYSSVNSIALFDKNAPKLFGEFSTYEINSINKINSMFSTESLGRNIGFSDCDDFLDAYEEFAMEYIEVLKDYNRNPDNTELYTRYLEMLNEFSQYTDGAEQCKDNPKIAKRILRIQTRLYEAAQDIY